MGEDILTPEEIEKIHKDLKELSDRLKKLHADFDAFWGIKNEQ